MANTVFTGAVQTADRVANMQPESWYKPLYQYVPLTNFPLLGILDKGFGSKTTPSRIHHWGEEEFEGQTGTVLDVYTNSGLSVAYASGGVVGTQLYIAVTTADAKRISAGNQMVIVSSSTMAIIRARVDDRNIGSDTTSWVLVTLQNADSGPDLDNTDLTWRTSGRAQPEGGTLPAAQSVDPTLYQNRTRIFAESVEFTRTAMAEQERFSPALRERNWKKCDQRFNMGIERALLFDVDGTYTDVNGKQVRNFDGLLSAFTQAGFSDRVISWPTDVTYSNAGDTWLKGGWKFLEQIGEVISRFGDGAKVTVFCGSGAMLAMNQLITDKVFWNGGSETSKYGLNIRTLTYLIENWNLVLDPVLTHDSAFRNSMVVVRPDFLDVCYFNGARRIEVTPGDAASIAEASIDGYSWVDATKGGLVSELTLQYMNMRSMCWINGVGQVKTV